MTLFEKKNISPMLIGVHGAPFDDPDYIYELKLDGIRCIVYLDRNGTDLRNKRNIQLLSKVPELSQIHKKDHDRKPYENQIGRPKVSGLFYRI